MTAVVSATTTPDVTIVRDQAGLDTPALVVDEAVLRRNIAEMAAFAKSVGVAIRPHVKTHKTPQIARLQLAAGAIGITCAKLGEAEVMVEQGGVEDVLMAYSPVGEIKVRRLLALLERARLIVALDSREAGEALSRAMAVSGRTIEVYVEVNTGHNRAGLRAGPEAVALALDLARLPGLRLVGVMTHEGHAHAVTPNEIEGEAKAAGRAMVETAEAIRRNGLELPVVSVGSTPAAVYTPTVAGVTEMRPGTYVFNDTNTLRWGRVSERDCALRVLATVVSRPAPDRAILDAGSKTISLEKSSYHPGHGLIAGHPRAAIAWMGEEHGVVNLPPEEPGFHVGDRVEIIPNHVCPTVNLQDRLYLIHDGRLTDVWSVAARGKVQ
jgi:D-serine deaminase-like pyridoxal phosphate-dependent protein